MLTLYSWEYPTRYINRSQNYYYDGIPTGYPVSSKWTFWRPTADVSEHPLASPIT